MKFQFIMFYCIAYQVKFKKNSISFPGLSIRIIHLTRFIHTLRQLYYDNWLFNLPDKNPGVIKTLLHSDLPQE